MDEMREYLHNREFPRSNAYDAEWVMDHSMGPNPLWLAEWLTRDLPLISGMRVLDLGCGKALTSVFLAREFDVRAHAFDLWTSVDENWALVVDAGEAQRVTPLHGEAHSLPFGCGFFDAILSIDAYQYFGTDRLYLQYLTRFLRPGGYVGVVVPGLVQPFPDDEVPRHLVEPQANGKTFWEDECVTFRALDWWRTLFKECRQVDVVIADVLENGWRHWRDFERALERAGRNLFPSDAEVLERDGGRFIGFVRIVARRNERDGYNLYDPELEAKVKRELQRGLESQ